MSCAVHTGMMRGNTKKNALRVKKPLRGLFRGSNLGCFGLSWVAFCLLLCSIRWAGWFSVGIQQQPAKTGKGKDMSKAQTVDTLPNNFVMRSDSLYCCRTGKGIMNVNHPNVSGNIPAILAKLISNGEMEMRSYPGSFQLPMDKVTAGTVLFRWGRRQKNGPYVQLAGYSVSVHNVAVLASIGLECKVQTQYTPNIVDIPTKPEPTKEPVVDSEYLFGSAPEVSKGDVSVLANDLQAMMEPDTPDEANLGLMAYCKPQNKQAPDTIDPLLLWPADTEVGVKGGFMKYRTRLKEALDLSNDDAIRVSKRVWEKYKSGDLSRPPVEIANAMLNEPVSKPANKPVDKPAIEMPAPPTEGGTVIRIPCEALANLVSTMGATVLAVHTDTKQYTVRLSS